MGHLDCSGDGVTPFVPRKQQLVFLFRIPLSRLCLPVGRSRRMLRQKRLATSSSLYTSPLSPFDTVEISCGIFGSRRQAPPSKDHHP
jgi:hypothetical protein